MKKEAVKPTKAKPTCVGCMFGKMATIVCHDKNGAETDRREVCECHVARPTRYGFPTVRHDDFCALHVDAKTGARTFKGLAPTASGDAW